MSPDSHPATYSFSLQTTWSFLVRTGAILFAIGLLVVIFSKGFGHGKLLGLVDLFDPDLESNFPSLFRVFLWLFAGLLLRTIALDAWRRRGPLRVHWSVLSWGILYMAVDDGFALHEEIMPPLARVLPESIKATPFHYAWVIPGLFIALWAGLYFRTFLATLPKPFGRRFFVSGSVFLLGAVGMEMIDGWYAGHHGTENLLYGLQTWFEEALELTGALLLVRTVLQYMNEHLPVLEVRFRER
jgi:hypothetical protein